MNYEDMSDFELSCNVASVAFGVDIEDMSEFTVGGKSVPVWGHSLSGLRSFDINNPTDVWPIILENKINITFRDKPSLEPMATKAGDDKLSHSDKNPLRAAMIFF